VAESVVVLPFPAHVGPLRELRSTVIVGSITVLRAAGHFERYEASLPAEARQALLHPVAGAWVPLELGLTHYTACDALGLAPDEATAAGRAIFDRLRGTLLGTMVRMAQGVGATPWTVLPHIQRFWDRVYKGGGLQVVKTGPKEARAEAIQVRVCDSPYYRYALCGVLQGVLGLCSQKAYVSVLAERRAAGVAYRLQWV
jgi:hypothetical protein